jgi:hypothetical protein
MNEWGLTGQNRRLESRGDFEPKSADDEVDEVLVDVTGNASKMLQKIASRVMS